MESIVRVENMMVIFLYSDLLCRVMVSHNHKQFVHQPLVALLRFAKEKSDEYVMFLREAIKEYKPNKKEKIGIVRPVSYFEEFVKEAESCWEPIKKDMYEKLCTIYQQIVNEIYNGIENVANESQKTPPDVVRFQNYHQLNRNSLSLIYVVFILNFDNIRCIEKYQRIKRSSQVYKRPILGLETELYQRAFRSALGEYSRKLRVINRP